MLQSAMSSNGMVVSPHHLATASGVSILRDGGTAIEAIIATAATLSIVYPHMNSIGGDGFWLILPPNENPFVIEACGGAGNLANREFFEGLENIPYRGPKAANTVAGIIGGWKEALNYVADRGYDKIPLSRLLADAIKYAEEGYPVSVSQEQDLTEFVNHEQPSKEFEKIYLPNGTVPKAGEIFYQKKLADTFKYLVNNGLESFYHGDLAKIIIEDIQQLGMPITLSDLGNYSVVRKTPLRFRHTYGDLYNTPPPTQGIASLAILGILDRLRINGKDEGQFIHTSVEATKLAFEMRNKYVTDPKYMTESPSSLLSERKITEMANLINPNKSTEIKSAKGPGDTVWLGAMDNKGFSVSYIQSIYHKFGSGVILPKTGILWHNRGTAFSLNPNNIQFIRPGKKPLHTLNPAAAKLNDGKLMIYGTRGGDGQPQTQTAIFHRYVVQGVPLQESVSAPRWLYGSSAGDAEDDLKLEGRFSNDTLYYLKVRGHVVEMYPAFSSEMGHAGALVRHTNGTMEGAFDPRSDGSAAGY